MILNKDDRARYIRLLQFVRPYWKGVVLSLLATLVYGMTEPLVPYIMQPLIDGGFAQQDSQTVYLLTGILFIGFIIRGIANFFSTYSSTWVAQQVVCTLRTRMFTQLLHLDMRYFDTTLHGNIVSRFTYDVVQLLSAATDTLIALLRDSITILALLACLFWLDWYMSMILMLAAPFLSWVIIFISRRLRQMARAVQADMGDMNHTIDQALRNRAIIRIFNGFVFESARFDAQAKSIEQHTLKSKKISALASPVLEIIIIMALCSVILLAAHKAQIYPTVMTAGKFVAFLGTMALLFPPVKRIGRINEPLQRGLAAMQSVFDFLDAPVEAVHTLPAHTITHGEICFDRVCFSYDNRPVLTEFSLTIHAGESVALVGESGSGKSTIAALLAGFYRPDSGTIFIDNHDTRRMNLSDQRQAIAYVSQETVLFSGTIADNIAYGCMSADRAKIINAAVSANADEFINQLPNGYDSEVGEQGSRLSGGQKQRIAIARALYKNAPILILDEATAALDNRSERKVQEAIEHLCHNRTTLIIAHRLSTIKNADRIVVLTQGKIVEMGTHTELLNRAGAYAKLLNQSLPEHRT